MEKMVFSLSTEMKDGKSTTVLDYDINGKKMTATFDPSKENEVDFVAKLFAGFNADLLKRAEIEEGDNVIVTDPGKRYPRAINLAIENLSKEQLILFGLGFAEKIEKGSKGTIVKIIPDKNVAAVQFEKHFIALMDMDGIEAVA